jgi:hypothetical protein
VSALAERVTSAVLVSALAPPLKKADAATVAVITAGVRKLFLRAFFSFDLDIWISVPHTGAINMNGIN